MGIHKAKGLWFLLFTRKVMLFTSVVLRDQVPSVSTDSSVDLNVAQADLILAT